MWFSSLGLVFIGAGAAAVPVVLHLFFRSRFRTVPWAAMKFLLTSIEQTSRRLKIQEYLLLLARVLVLVLFAMALARLWDASFLGLGALLLGVVLTAVTLTWPLAPFWKVARSAAASAGVYVATQALLLLLCAGFWLLFLAVILAPQASAAGPGEAVDAVFLFDVSYSMGAREGGDTRLEAAKTAARGILDHLPPHSTVQVVTCADRAALLGPRSPANLDQARELIDGLTLTSLGTDLYPGVLEATAALKRGQAANKELYVFSDMQKQGWRQAEKLAKAMRDVDERGTVYLVRCCGPRPPPNVAVVGVTPQAGVPRPGERVGFAVLLRNSGAEPLRDLEVSLVVHDDEQAKEEKGKEKQRETQAVPVLGAGETRAVTLSVRMDRPGLRVVTAAVKHDALGADNRFDQVVLVRDRVRALVVDGSPDEQDPGKSSAFYLLHALTPVKETERAKWYLQPKVVGPRGAAPGLLDDQDLCVLVNVSVKRTLRNRADAVAPDFLEALSDWVRQGKGLMIFGGDNVDPLAYSLILGHQHELLPLPLRRLHQAPADGPLRLNRDTLSLPAFAVFKEDDLYKPLNSVEVWRALDGADTAADKTTLPAGAVQVGPIEPELRELLRLAAEKGGGKWLRPGLPEGATVVLRHDNGLPAVATRRVDSGEVMLFTTAASPGWKADSPDPTWTDWPLRPEYIPFMNVAVSHLLHRQTQSHNAVAGEPLRWLGQEDDAGRSFTLVTPTDEKVRLGMPEVVQGRPVVTYAAPQTAGVYRLRGAAPPRAAKDKGVAPPKERETDAGLPFAVVPDLRESDSLDALGESELDDLLGFRPVHVRAGIDPGSFAAAELGHQEWAMWLFLAALAALLGESVLAWFTGRAW